MTTFSAAIVSSAAIVGTRTSAQIKRTKVKYMTSGLNSFGGQKENNHVASLGLPMFSLQTPSQTKGRALICPLFSDFSKRVIFNLLQLQASKVINTTTLQID
ncbi:hypothetical protein P3S68_009536 [Capsicum galapagoense]